MTRPTPWALIAAILFCLPVSKAEISFINAELGEVRDRAALEGKLYFVHFTASWCMPCQWMEEHTFSDPRLSQYVNNHYLPVQFDVDESRGRRYKQQFSVRALPSLLIFNAQGVLIDRYEESLEPEAMLKILQTHDKPANKTVADAQNGAQAAVLNSPRPRFAITRPALIPEQAKPANYSPGASTGSNVIQPEQRPVVTTKLKSDKGYGIQIGVYTDYANALVEVRRLEQKFNQPVNLYGGEQNGKQVYKVIVGLFPSKSEAQQYLDYLHRNDILGFVKEVNSEQ